MVCWRIFIGCICLKSVFVSWKRRASASNMVEFVRISWSFGWEGVLSDNPFTFPAIILKMSLDLCSGMFPHPVSS